jgi:predicted TIM-barrel enzyme
VRNVDVLGNLEEEAVVRCLVAPEVVLAAVVVGAPAVQCEQGVAMVGLVGQKNILACAVCAEAVHVFDQALPCLVHWDGGPLL